MSAVYKCVFSFISVLFLLLPVSCLETEETANEKISGLLLTQVNLRMEQIDKPTTERLNMMKQMGMMIDNLENQRIFIHLKHELNDSQVKELQNIGLTLYLDSWIPPVGAHPTGYIIADMPIEVLEELADKEYIVNLEIQIKNLL